MATKKKKTQQQETPRIKFDQMTELMRGSGTRADAMRAEGLNGLVATKRSKVVQLRRERARLALRFGETSPRVARIDRQMAAEHRLLVNARAETARVETPMLDRKKFAWQLHGYIRNPDGIARRNHTVALVADTEARKTLAATTTDKRGYFHFDINLASKDPVIPKDDVFGGAPIAEEISAPVDADGGETSAPSDAGSNEAQVAQLFAALKVEVFLATSSPSGGKPMVNPRALHVVAGAVVYRDLVVADTEDDGDACELKTRFLADASARQVHDLTRETRACGIAAIPIKARFYLTFAEQAEALAYKHCPYCFGTKSGKV
ncbi:hypothetical protein SAMN05421688_0869 [Poseidonocella pacifica]|uniref:Uncharacterized protein n=1 Tax=Poseidonocella pacifica TaxID=871651 RepID=A0A1I0VR79_9RHOB|nr:hypothetical protein [Poseidonocella pacifica]SFA78537.1 hypothetical protein SAMN05421688_0869 [Poseidonocella pacifica]